MQDLSLYENVVRGDKEFPVQLQNNHVLHKGFYFFPPVSYTHLDVYKRQIPVP